MQIVKNALAEYGATLDDSGHICKDGKVLGVRASVIRYRIRFEVKGRLIASGPHTDIFVRSFVESFYLWEKTK